VTEYLALARQVIATLNEANPERLARYMILATTTDVILSLKRPGVCDMNRVILVSTRWQGNPTLMARLFSINRRSHQATLYLVYDEERMQSIMSRHLAADAPVATADDDDEELAPQQIRSRIRRRYRNHVDPAADPEGLRENQPTGTRSWQRPAGLDRSNQGRSAHLCHHSAPGELRQLRIQGGDFAGRSCRHSAGQERCSRSRRQRLGA
jgi:hypothetical protein